MASPRARANSDELDDGDALARDKLRQPMDVVHRILWDDSLSHTDFTVGYIDRFVGIVERSFDEFDWTDITSDFAIPKHRIQYFKYKHVIVWDRRTRIDNVFGGRENATTIRDVIAEYEREHAAPAAAVAAVQRV
jgi:uncharacterized protein (UPF0248 family)